MESRVSRETEVPSNARKEMCVALKRARGAFQLSFIDFCSAPSFRSFRRTSQLISHSTYIVINFPETKNETRDEVINSLKLVAIVLSLFHSQQPIRCCVRMFFHPIWYRSVYGTDKGERIPKNMLETREQLAERIDGKFLIQFPNCLNEFRVKFFLLDFCSNNKLFFGEMWECQIWQLSKLDQDRMIKDFALNFSSDEPTSRDDKNRQSIFVMQILKFHQRELHFLVRFLL